MNLYSFNKSIFNGKPPLSQKETEKGIELLKRFFTRHVLKNRQYFMLLGRDVNYYTLFTAIHTDENAASAFATEVMECLKNLGEIKAIDRDDVTKTNIEIWITTEEEKEKSKESFCLYLFPYDEGVIEI